MGYIEGNMGGMDYTFAGAAGQYPLWKPPSGYFPRGEAPPPYEEAVAVSTAEALSVVSQRNIAMNNPVELPSVDAARRLTTINQTQQQSEQDTSTTTITTQALVQQHFQQPNIETIQQTTTTLPLHRHLQQQPKPHQITQSTTNLINININTGANLSTISSGENQQPPFRYQRANFDTHNDQQQHEQQQQQQQRLQHQPYKNMLSGQMHMTPNNNSIYLKKPTMEEHESQQQQHQQQQTIKLQQQPTKNNNDGNKSSRIAECTYKNCCLNNTEAQQYKQKTTNQRAITSTELMQEYQKQSVDFELNTVGYGTNNLDEDVATNRLNEATARLLPTSSQFFHSNIDNNVNSNVINIQNNLDDITTLPRPISIRQNDLNSEIAAVNMATQNVTSTLPDINDTHTVTTPTSTKPILTRRYHRKIPRYFTMHEHTIQNNPQTSNNINMKNKKQIINRSGSGGSNVKKSTCQCPVQHVPISASPFQIGQTQFFSTFNNKSGTNDASHNSSPASNHCTRPNQRPILIENTASSNYNATNSQQSNIQHRNNNSNNRLIQFCAHDTKICTISNQVEAEHNQQPHQSTDVAYAHSPNAVSSSTILPLMAHDECAPILLGRVRDPRKSTCTNERLRNISNGNKHGCQTQHTDNDASPSTAFFLSGKVDAYLNFSHSQQLQHEIEEQLVKKDNIPVLPPKLYKSLTNLKINSATATILNNTTLTVNSITATPTVTTVFALGKSSTETMTSASNSNLSTTSAYSHNDTKHPPKMSFSISVMKNISPPSVVSFPISTSPSKSIRNKKNSDTVSKSSEIMKSTKCHPYEHQNIIKDSTSNVVSHVQTSLHCSITNVVNELPSVINIPNIQKNLPKIQSPSMRDKITPDDRCIATVSTTLPNKINTNNKNSKLSKISTIVTEASILKIKNTPFPTIVAANSSGARNNLLWAPSKSEEIPSSNILTITPTKHLPVCTTTVNCQNPREHFLPNDTSLDDDYLSECENCKIAQTAKYYLVDTKSRDTSGGSQRETMTLQRKYLDVAKEDQNLTGYYRISHTLPTNSKKNVPINSEPWFSTISASSSSEDDAIE